MSLNQRHVWWNLHRSRGSPRRYIVAQALTLTLTDVVDRQNSRDVRIIVVAKGHAAASQTVVLNHLLHLQLDQRTVDAIFRYIALHERAVEAPGDPGTRVDLVLHAGDVLPGVVAVTMWDGVHVIAEGVHDTHLVGANAHDCAAFAVEALIQV